MPLPSHGSLGLPRQRPRRCGGHRLLAMGQPDAGHGRFADREHADRRTLTRHHAAAGRRQGGQAQHPSAGDGALQNDQRIKRDGAEKTDSSCCCHHTEGCGRSAGFGRRTFGRNWNPAHCNTLQRFRGSKQDSVPMR